MGKKTKKGITKNTRKPKAVNNGFGAAIGFGQLPFAGQSGFPGGPAMQQVESTTTVFENLRWYLASNFRQLLSQAFVEIGLVQTIVCVPVDDALRGGIMIKSKQLDEDEIKQLSISIDRDDDLTTVGWTAKWNRLFGGAGTLILVGDQDPSTPLDIASIDENTELMFRDVDMWELFWDKQNTEGYNPTIDSEEFEYYSYYSEQVHKSRVMKMKALQAPSFIRPRLRGWGVSVVETLVRSLNQYLKATDLGFEVLDEFKIDVYKLKGLVNTLMSPGGTEKTKMRTQQTNWQKNYQHAIVLDSEDEYLQKQLSFAGLAETMEGIRMQVAADMRMPITKLFGTSASSGFQTDQNDMENYNSMVESEVRNKIKYDILRICEIKCQKLFGKIPEDLEIEFKPLRELGAVDQENVKTQKFTRLIQARGVGAISEVEFRDSCNKGNLFDVQLDTDNLDDLGIGEDTAETDDKDPLKETDTDDPGANRTDSRKPKVGDKGDVAIGPFSKAENSARFDKASYEADGGDSQMSDEREKLFENPGNVDKALWAKAKDASHKSLGEIDYKFVTWWYKKQGGKF